VYALAWVAVFAAAAISAPDTPNPYSVPTAAAGERGVSVERVQGRGVVWWSRHAVQARKDANARALTIRRLHQVLRHEVTIVDSIKLAATTYGVDAAMLERKASCESHYNRNAVGHTRVGREYPLGLFQFLPSTWRSTPYASFSPFDPLAASLAAGWMHAHGRGGEWACR
jgi:hypothetical protein